MMMLFSAVVYFKSATNTICSVLFDIMFNLCLELASCSVTVSSAVLCLFFVVTHLSWWCWEALLNCGVVRVSDKLSSLERPKGSWWFRWKAKINAWFPFHKRNEIYTGNNDLIQKRWNSRGNPLKGSSFEDECTHFILANYKLIKSLSWKMYFKFVRSL